MVHVHSSKERQIVFIEFTEHVSAEDMEAIRPRIEEELAAMNPGFALVTDFSNLGSMDTAAAKPITSYMDLVNQGGVGLIVRVIADPTKDIGFQLMTHFHYDAGVKTLVFDNLGDALKSLES